MTTGNDGFFSVFVPANGKTHQLIISSAGYSTLTVPLKAAEGVLFRLKREPKNLDDVVVLRSHVNLHIDRAAILQFASDIVHQAIFPDMYYFAKPPSIADIYSGAAKVDIPPVTEGTPRFRDIHISNIVCDGAEEGIFVRGLPEMNVSHIYLDNMVLKAAKGAELAEAQGVHLANIRLVTSDTDPVIYVENSSQLTFDHIGYDKGAPLLFSINGDKSSDIKVTATDGSQAVRKAAFQFGAAEQTLQLN